MFSFSKSKSKKSQLINDISQIKPNNNIEDIFILGNGPSLNNISPEDIKDYFKIGTNRSWLWGKTDILIWRDERITEELDFFKVDKEQTLWLAGEPAFSGSKVNLSDDTIKNIDYTFKDSWKDQIIGKGIKWNGIVFHAIAVASHLSPKANIHLIGIDLGITGDSHHFFNDYKGFNQGFYKNNWNGSSFNYEKRLNMMLKNFELLQKRGLNFINHSKKSHLTELFGFTQI